MASLTVPVVAGLAAMAVGVTAPPQDRDTPAARAVRPGDQVTSADPAAAEIVRPVDSALAEAWAARRPRTDRPVADDVASGPPGSGLTIATVPPPPVLTGGAAALAVIDFEDLGVAPGTQLNPAAGVCVNTAGYDYCPGPNNDSGLNDLHISNQQSFFSWNGTTVGGSHDDVVLSRPDGQPFRLDQFDFAGFPLNNEIPFIVTAQPSGQVVGFTPDGVVDGDPDGAGGLVDYQTFALPPNFVGTSFTWEHYGPGTTQGAFALDNIVVSPAAPPNDTCEGAILVGNGNTFYDMNGALADDATTCFTFCPCPDIFFRYEANFNGQITVSVCSDSDFTGLEVYEGCGCPLTVNTFLDCGNCNVLDPGCFGECRSEVTVDVTAGQCYTIWIAQDLGIGTGVLTITKDITPPPACEPLIYDNGDFDLVSGVQPTAGWTENGIIDDMTLPQIGGTAFSCFTADFFTIFGDGNLETMRLRIYDLPPGGIPALGDFNLEVPIYDTTVSVAAGTLQHVDTGADAFGYDLVRLIAEVPPADIGAGHFGVHLTFPGDGVTGFWATAPNSPTDCSHVWGLTNTLPEDICPNLGEDFRNLAFKFGNPLPDPCPWDCSDGNGVVDIVDLLALLSQWNGPGSCDFDGNGTVNIVDLLALLANWGPCPVCGLPDAGNCYVPNGTPGCDDAACCEEICAIDPFCCDIQWDQICADEALQFCLVPIDCASTTNCQSSDIQNASQSNGVTFTGADNFVLASGGTVTSLCWRGAYFSGTDCGPGPDNYTVTYYADAGGLPGAMIAQFRQADGTLTVSPPVPTGNIIAGIATEYEGVGTHAPITLSPGVCYWVEIINPGPISPCLWFWTWSADGDLYAVEDAGPGVYDPADVSNIDRSFCLDQAIGGAPPCPQLPAPTPPEGDRGDLRRAARPTPH
jgi:hypothetical protein